MAVDELHGEAIIWQDLQGYYTKILNHGPDRVVITAEGEAIGWKRAYENFSILPTIIFIRGDGWTLGAAGDLIPVAYNLWKNRWVGFMRQPDMPVFPISEWFGE